MPSNVDDLFAGRRASRFLPERDPAFTPQVQIPGYDNIQPTGWISQELSSELEAFAISGLRNPHFLFGLKDTPLVVSEVGGGATLNNYRLSKSRILSSWVIEQIDDGITAMVTADPTFPAAYSLQITFNGTTSASDAATFKMYQDVPVMASPLYRFDPTEAGDWGISSLAAASGNTMPNTTYRITMEYRNFIHGAGGASDATAFSDDLSSGTINVFRTSGYADVEPRPYEEDGDWGGAYYVRVKLIVTFAGE